MRCVSGLSGDSAADWKPDPEKAGTGQRFSGEDGGARRHRYGQVRAAVSAVRSSPAQRLHREAILAICCSFNAPFREILGSQLLICLPQIIVLSRTLRLLPSVAAGNFPILYAVTVQIRNLGASRDKRQAVHPVTAGVNAAPSWACARLANMKNSAPPRKHPVNHAKLAIGCNAGINVMAMPTSVARMSAFTAV